MIRVAVADDQPLVRAGFGALVAHAADLVLVGEAADGEAAVALVAAEAPDVVLMDVRMPVLDGLAATRRILADPTVTTRVLVLTTFDVDEYVFGALEAGASGFLLKDATPEALLEAIRVVHRGEALLAAAVTRRVIERFASARAGRTDPGDLARLTDREREVLGLVGRGLTNGEIAQAAHMSPATAKTHVGRILAKLGARDRAQLVITAYETGLVVPGT